MKFIFFQSKEGKQSFLDKYINLVYLYLGGSFSDDDILKSSKVVAGKEPEKTNVFLQHLAIAATRCKKGTSCARQVKQVLSGMVAGDASSSAPPPRESESKREDPPRASEVDPVKLKPSKVDDEPKREEKIVKPTPKYDDVKSSAPAPVAAPTRAAEEESKGGDGGDGEDGDGIRRVDRPKTARKKPPKLKESSNEESKSGSKTTAAPVGIFVDGDANDQLNDSDDDQPSVAHNAGINREDIEGGTHSKLVQKILEEEKKSDKKDKKGSKEAPADDKKDEAG